MTSTPEQSKPEVESLPLSDRLLRIRNAFIELELARYSVGLQSYYPDEVAAAYVETRIAERASRAVLDEHDHGSETPDGVIPEHVQKQVAWKSDMNLVNCLRNWVEPPRLVEIDEQFSE